MDINGSRPNQAPVKAEAASKRTVGRQRHPIAFMVLTIVFILISFGSVLGAAVFIKMTATEVNVSQPDSAKYQAVFMSNGQVYFGKMGGATQTYQTLTDVYYLQVQQPVQPAAKITDATASQISLTKLGNELHGPTDKMNISQDQVLFWEDLKDDSAIVKAIAQYKAKE